MKTISSTNLLPKQLPSLKLITTGATVGPLVDSLHNQCLLQYGKAPIDIPNFITQTDNASCLIRTSWYIPPLLGMAYLVLGGILPRIFNTLLENMNGTQEQLWKQQKSCTLRNKAIYAVTSTALIIKLSEILETSTVFTSSETNLCIMTAAAVAQWAVLDRSLASLLAAMVVSVGGPLSELPFVAGGYWHYIPSAADYFPLRGVNLDWGFWKVLFGDDYGELALSSITGPCYFAVTMDAIALGRWFDSDVEEGVEEGKAS